MRITLLSIRRGLLFLGGLLLTLELLYGVSAAIYLNSSAFIRTLGMEDETRTYVRVKNAWSPFPGFLRAQEVLVAVRDSNVRIDIRLHGVRFPFEVSPLFHKRLEVKDLQVSRTTVKVELRSDRERRQYLKDHPDPHRYIPYSDKEIAELKKSRWTIHIPKLSLQQVGPIRIGGRDTVGSIRIDGGFELQPGVEAEIFPTTVKYANTRWGNVLSNLQGESVARFYRFSVPRTSGSAVFSYFDADVKLAGKCENFDFLNLTLRSLKGFGFTHGHSDFRAEISARRGRLQAGSRFETPDGPLELRNPTFRLRGDGYVRWYIPQDDGTSRLAFVLRRAEGHASFRSFHLRGTALRLQTEARIFGVHLKSPFTSLRGSFAVERGMYAIESRTRFPWGARGRIDGALSGMTADVPLARGESTPESSGLEVSIDEGHVSIPFPTPDRRPVPFTAKGKIGFSGRTLVLTQRATLPSARFDLLFKRDTTKGNTDSDALQKPAYLRVDLGAPVKILNGDSKWAGTVNVRISRFNEILEQLEEGELISKAARTAASANRVRLKIRWENQEGTTRVVADPIQSDGAWSGKGSFSRTSKGDWLALVEATALGLPVAISLTPDQTDWKLLPREKFLLPSERR